MLININSNDHLQTELANGLKDQVARLTSEITSLKGNEIALLRRVDEGEARSKRDATVISTLKAKVVISHVSCLSHTRAD